jgi:prepilin-type N-terminal cleavage/methylation domain-containing protein/prepilin-type processing-associated H-X9-DG protein
MKRKRGFTLIELLVVVAIIAILLAILVPGLSKAKEMVKKSICKNSIRQQCLGTILYSEGNNGWVPTVNSTIGNWFWDVSFSCTNEISRESGINYKSFFCPVNRLKNPDDARYWQFDWVFDWGVNLKSPLQHRDESKLTLQEQRTYFRVLPYIYMFDRYDPATLKSSLRPNLVTGEKATWIRKLTDLKNASSTMMIMDAVISEMNATNFSDITVGGSWGNFNIPDSTNHLTRQTVPGGTGAEFKPEGANAGYADGHVEWRPFKAMLYRYQLTANSPWFWW